MGEPTAATRHPHFGGFQVDLRAGELRKQGRRVKLQEQPFQLLAILLERPGEVITREELHKRLWPADTFVDFDHGLNIAVNKLRQALGDSADEPRFIETLPRRGYRFLAIIEEPAVPAPLLEESPADPRPARRSKWPAIIAALALAALVFGGIRVKGWWGRRSASPAARPIESLAVLPLENLSGDPQQEYFADGMTDELITCLAQISTVRVISRTSVMRYKGARKLLLPEIGRELGVDAVVEGSVARSGNRVRVRAQLIRASTDQHLWAESFEREMQDVLLLQSEVASAIARQIQVKLAMQQPVRLGGAGLIQPAAYEAYLKGRLAWNKRSEAGIQEGIDYFQQAISIEPSYAAAYSGLADSYTTLGYLSYLSPTESFPRAKTAATKALALDAALAEPHASLAYGELYFDWDWAEAEKEFKKAIALNPSYATAHHWHSVYLTAMGRPEEAMAAIRRAQQLDPLSIIIPTDIGFQLYYTRRYDEAIQQLKSILQVNPAFPLAHLWLGRAYQQKGAYQEAISEFNQAEKVLRDWAPVVAAVGYVQGKAGLRADALKTSEQLKRLSGKKYVTAYGIALVYAGLGDKNRAFAWLSKAVEERTHWLVWLKLDPRWDDLRSDPRFEQLVRRVGLP